MTNSEPVDAIVIGGGFYGCVIANYLSRERRFKKVLLVEREAHLLTRASYRNQARVHSGYHYPRSFTTAYRSQINAPQFMIDWQFAVTKKFTKLYAISRRNSKVNAQQFRRFCREIGARLEPADLAHRQLFEHRLIEEVFLAEETVFDATLLAAWAEKELAQSGVEVALNTKAQQIFSTNAKRLKVKLHTGEAGEAEAKDILSRFVFNCTYSGLNQIAGGIGGTSAKLKHEIAELALIRCPSPLLSLGITVMDGPFFSVMPFPARGLHTLSHVRYTPHLSWEDRRGIDPYARLEGFEKVSRADRMMRDAARYLPCLSEAQYMDSLFEVKTVLVRNEVDDGRPILFEQHSGLPGYFSILGGKIDNIFDAIQRLDNIVL